MTTSSCAEVRVGVWLSNATGKFENWWGYGFAFYIFFKYSLFQSLPASYFQSVFNMLICLNLFWNANSLFARLETPPDYHTDRTQLGLFPGIQLTSLLAIHLLFMIHLFIYIYLLFIYSLFIIHDKHTEITQVGIFPWIQLTSLPYILKLISFISKARIGWYTLVRPQYYKVWLPYRQSSTLSLIQMNMILIHFWLKGKYVYLFCFGLAIAV